MTPHQKCIKIAKFVSKELSKRNKEVRVRVRPPEESNIKVKRSGGAYFEIVSTRVPMMISKPISQDGSIITVSATEKEEVITFKYKRVIVICSDIIEATKDKDMYFENRFFNFLKGIDVEVNQYSIFLMVLLHEFGHADLFDLFESNDMMDELEMLSNNSDNIISFLLKDRDIPEFESDMEVSFGQTVSFVEQYCDNYALKKFYPMWKKIQHLLE